MKSQFAVIAIVSVVLMLEADAVRASVQKVDQSTGLDRAADFVRGLADLKATGAIRFDSERSALSYMVYIRQLEETIHNLQQRNPHDCEEVENYRVRTIAFLNGTQCPAAIVDQIASAMGLFVGQGDFEFIKKLCGSQIAWATCPSVVRGYYRYPSSGRPGNQKGAVAIDLIARNVGWTLVPDILAALPRYVSESDKAAAISVFTSNLGWSQVAARLRQMFGTQP